MSAADKIQPKQLTLFDPAPYTHREDLTDWAKDEGVVWHATTAEHFPEKEEDWRAETPDDKTAPWRSSNPHPLGMHAGTLYAAALRTKHSKSARAIYPLRVQGSSAAVPSEWAGVTEDIWTDNEANGRLPESTEAVRSGKNVWYENDYEDTDSLSVRAPRKNLQTWSEHVLANPYSHSIPAVRAAVRGYELSYIDPKNDFEEKRAKTPRGLTVSSIRATPADPFSVYSPAMVRPRLQRKPDEAALARQRDKIRDIARQRRLPGMEG